MKGNVKNRIGTSGMMRRHQTGEVHPNGVKGRTGSRKGHRLAARQASHAEFPVAADGSQYANYKPKAKQPGSRNPAKH